MLLLIFAYLAICCGTLIGQLNSNDQELQEWLANGVLWPLYWGHKGLAVVGEYLRQRKTLPPPDPFYLEGLREVEEMLYGENKKPKQITQYEDVRPFDIQVGGASSIRMVGNEKVITTNGEVIDTKPLKDFLDDYTPIPPKKIEG